MSSSDWRPGIDVDLMRQRAELLARVRAFFAARSVLEVDTPVLGSRTVTDPALESIATAAGGWLQTSPEYFMKRLLAAGAGAIYQIAHAFRGGELGRLHNPEFLLLEWYRPGYDDRRLMVEIDALCARLLPGFPARRLGYRALLRDAFGVDALRADGDALMAALGRFYAAAGRDADPRALTGGERTALLDLAYAEACATLRGAVFITDFPPEQAALARLRVDADGCTVAARFELVVDGVELANGFHELTDAVEQRARFEADRARRAAEGTPAPELDERLLAALAAGMPACAGVALGLDRVLMLRSGRGSLDAVMPFSAPRS